MKKEARFPFPMYSDEALVRPKKNTYVRARRPQARAHGSQNASLFFRKYDQYFV